MNDYAEIRRFVKHSSGVMRRIIQINDIFYVVDIPISQWNRQNSKILSKSITSLKKGNDWNIDIGTITKTSDPLKYISYDNNHICSKCLKQLKSNQLI